MKRPHGHASVEEHPPGSGLMDVFSALLQPEPTDGHAWFELMARRDPGRSRVLYVYFIQCNGDKGPIKIGIARDVPSRLAHLRIANPYPLVVLATRPGTAKDEHALHRRFQKLRIQGEWFRPGPALVQFVSDLQRGAVAA